MSDMESWLQDARDHKPEAEYQLITHFLARADSEKWAAAAGPLTADTQQETALAIVIAIRQYVAGPGDAAHLAQWVRDSVTERVRLSTAAESEAELTAQRFVSDAELLQATKAYLRQQLQRAPDAAEIARLLKWSLQRVELIESMLGPAEALSDADILPYLDDLPE